MAWVWVWVWVATGREVGSVRLRGQAPAEVFEVRIRPLFEEHCLECHSAERGRVKGGLALDTPEGLKRGGDSGVVVVPGNPDTSRLIRAVRYQESTLQMPPKERLRPDQVADLEAWVRSGAVDTRPARPVAAPGAGTGRSRYWAFQPVRAVPPPRVKNRRWVRDPLDYFVLSELEDRRLKPSGPADRETWIRRVTFDLTGLPPSRNEIQSFLADTGTNASARVVDRLLASPHFGERWGRHWLDVVRYADSNGTEFNAPYPNAWRYRDYVVRAFNADKPFDRFVREQIAGDLLADAAPGGEEATGRLAATGFLVLGPKVLFEPNRARLTMDIVDEQIDVTCRAFMGLTVACARCHDHKFDPIPTRDYYALAGIFRSTETLMNPAGTERGPGRVQWLERPIGDPAMAAAVERHRAEVARLEEERGKAREQRMNFPGNINSERVPGIVVDNLAAEVTGSWRESIGSTNFVDRNYLADGNAEKGRKRVRFVPTLPKAGMYEVLVSYAPLWNRATNVPVTVEHQGGVSPLILDQTRPPTIDRIFVSLGTYRFGAGTNGAVTIANAGTRGFVVADAARFVPVEPGPPMMAGPGGRMAAAGPKEPRMMAGGGSEPAFVMSAPDLDALDGKLAELRERTPPSVPTVMAVQEGQVADCPIHVRGDPDQLGEVVARGFVRCAEGESGVRGGGIATGKSGRLELAEWLVRPGHPLTARVMVNRIWQHLLGRGLVSTPDNFGALSEPPSHPELLDHLAARFVRDGWSVKRLIRAIALSATYQMSSGTDPVSASRDPENVWLWRMNRRRLESEAIADALLVLSGRLDRTVGGPAGSTNDVAADTVISPATQDAMRGVGLNRRSLYRPVIRNGLDDVQKAFDFPDPQTVAGRRHSTASASQALFLMNSPQVIEWVGAWVDRLLSMGGMSDSELMATAWMEALGRSPSRAEQVRALAFLEAAVRREGERGRSGDEARRGAWRQLCQAVIAGTEFRYLD